MFDRRRRQRAGSIRRATVTSAAGENLACFATRYKISWKAATARRYCVSASGGTGRAAGVQPLGQTGVCFRPPGQDEETACGQLLGGCGGVGQEGIELLHDIRRQIVLAASRDNRPGAASRVGGSPHKPEKSAWPRCIANGRKRRLEAPASGSWPCPTGPSPGRPAGSGCGIPRQRCSGLPAGRSLRSAGPRPVESGPGRAGPREATLCGPAAGDCLAAAGDAVAEQIRCAGDGLLGFRPVVVFKSGRPQEMTCARRHSAWPRSNSAWPRAAKHQKSVADTARRFPVDLLRRARSRSIPRASSASARLSQRWITFSARACNRSTAVGRDSSVARRSRASRAARPILAAWRAAEESLDAWATASPRAAASSTSPEA